MRLAIAARRSTAALTLLVGACSSGSSGSQPLAYTITDLGAAGGLPGMDQLWADQAKAYLNNKGEVAATVNSQPSIFYDNAWHPVATVVAALQNARVVGFSDNREMVAVTGTTYFIDAVGNAQEITPPMLSGYSRMAVAGAMSPNGTVAGTFYVGTSSPATQELFLWKGGVFADRGPGQEVFGVNDAGAMVVATNTTGVITGSSLSLPDGTSIPLTSGLNPSGCNASGVVGGEVGHEPGFYPALLDHGNVVNLNGTHPRDNVVLADTGWVTALNDAGDAVGVVNGGDEPFVALSGGPIQSLAPVFATLSNPFPIAINNRGEILAWASAPTTGISVFHLFLLRPATAASG